MRQKRHPNSLPLLRAPPFPGAPVSLSQLTPQPSPQPSAASANTLSALREARVGAAFWLPPAALDRPPAVVVRVPDAHAIPILAAQLPPADPQTIAWIVPPAQVRNTARTLAPAGSECFSEVDPWSVLEGAGRLVAYGDDEWIAIACLLGVPVTALSAGRYAAPGEDAATMIARVTAALDAYAYVDPFTDKPATAKATIALLSQWRREIAANRHVAVASGMAWWKRDEIRRFLWTPERRLPIVRNLQSALALARRNAGAIAVWPSRVSPQLLEAARGQGTGVIRVEDGFVRSAGLGSNLVPPSSVVVDQRGIHFDPSGPSDLEHILQATPFGPDILARAKALRASILSGGISKYAAGPASDVPPRPSDRRVVLVPAQVEDDMSVLAGGGGLASNLELLRRARTLEPDAEIWFRPHPDVEAGHRKGAVPDAEVLQYADRIVRGGGMAPLLDVVDGVHALTSLTGFEALMRGRDVTCHGTPFYAGWGLTRDLGTVPPRRARTLTLDELVAGVLILYPRYLDPVSRLPCPPEVLIARMQQASVRNRLGWIAPLRQWQGRFMARWR